MNLIALVALWMSFLDEDASPTFPLAACGLGPMQVQGELVVEQ